MPSASTIGAVIIFLALAGCSKAGSLSDRPSSTPQSNNGRTAPLNMTQRKLVDTGLRQIINQPAITPRIVSMNTGKAKQPRQTNVCGYVSYKTSKGGAAEQRYFIRLGPENGVETTLMGQIANNPANAAKVKFMCAQAGLE